MTGYRHQISPLIKAASPRGSQGPCTGPRLLGYVLVGQVGAMVWEAGRLVACGMRSVAPTETIPHLAGAPFCMTKEMTFLFGNEWDTQCSWNLESQLFGFGGGGNQRSGSLHLSSPKFPKIPTHWPASFGKWETWLAMMMISFSNQITIKPFILFHYIT